MDSICILHCNYSLFSSHR